MFNQEKFSHAIKTLRKAENKSIYELAIMADINYTSLSHYEQNRKPYRVSAVVNLCNYFNLKICDLLSDEVDFESNYYIKKIETLLKHVDSDKQYLHLRKALEYMSIE